MERNTLVTVVMLTYGHELFIKQAIESVLAQEVNFDYELLIVNDCSPDKSDEVILNTIANHPKKELVRYVRHASNIGMRNNWKWVSQQIKSKYIAFCDGDDYFILSDKLQKQVDFLESNPEYGVVYTDIKYCYEKTKTSEVRRTRQVKDFEDLLVKNWVISTTTCFKREIFEDYYKEDYDNLPTLGFDDYSLWLLAINKSKIKYLPIISGGYRVLEESASHSNDMVKIVDFEEGVHTCRMYYLNKYYTSDKEQLKKKLLGSKTLSIIRLALKNKDEEVFEKYKGDLKYIASYKYKYYLIYSLARLNFKLFVKMYN